MERLTQRHFKKSDGYYMKCSGNNRNCYKEDFSCEDCVHLEILVNRLGEIEDILGDNYDLDRLREIVEADRDGRLHIFPVKIGETVWFEDPDDVIRSEKIERHNAYTCTETIGFENSDIGKYVFFSREAAEAALKGEQNDVQGI